MLVCSDAHNNPQALNPHTRAIIELGAKEKQVVIFDGDTFNILPWGYKKWMGCPCIEEFKAVVYSTGCIVGVVDGNHDPYKYLLKLLFEDSDSAGAAAVFHKVLALDGIEIRHGHRWAVDWAVLRHIAPPIVEFMTDHFPALWYKICKWMGWLPSLKKDRWWGLKSSDDYQKAVLAGWMGALGYAHKHNKRLIVGHTHQFGQVTRGDEGGIVLADGGALRDGKFYEVKDGAIKERRLYE